MGRKVPIRDLFLAAKQVEETGFLPEGFPLRAEEIKEQVRELRPKMIQLQELFERMQEDPSVTAERFSVALQAIKKDFPSETQFLNKIVNEKLIGGEFQERVVTLMCDVSNVQQGLVDPDRAFMIFAAYLDILEEIRRDEDLRSEMQRVLEYSKSS